MQPQRQKPLLQHPAHAHPSPPSPISSRHPLVLKDSPTPPNPQHSKASSNTYHLQRSLDNPAQHVGVPHLPPLLWELGELRQRVVGKDERKRAAVRRPAAHQRGDAEEHLERHLGHHVRRVGKGGAGGGLGLGEEVVHETHAWSENEKTGRARASGNDTVDGVSSGREAVSDSERREKAPDGKDQGTAQGAETSSPLYQLLKVAAAEERRTRAVRGHASVAATNDTTREGRLCHGQQGRRRHIHSPQPGAPRCPQSYPKTTRGASG